MPGTPGVFRVPHFVWTGQPDSRYHRYELFTGRVPQKVYLQLGKSQKHKWCSIITGCVIVGLCPRGCWVGQTECKYSPSRSANSYSWKLTNPPIKGNMICMHMPKRQPADWECFYKENSKKSFPLGVDIISVFWQMWVLYRLWISHLDSQHSSLSYPGYYRINHHRDAMIAAQAAPCSNGVIPRLNVFIS